MSDLAFLSSDDEVELDKASASASASASDSGKIVEEQNLIVNEEDEDESDEEFGNDFEFGGLLVSFCLILFWFTLNWVQFHVYCMDLILLTHPHHIHIHIICVGRRRRKPRPLQPVRQTRKQRLVVQGRPQHIATERQ